MDEFVDSLLRDDRVFDVILPRLTKRFVHVENGELPKRVSLIDEDLDLEENERSDSEHNSRYQNHYHRRSPSFDGHSSSRDRRHNDKYRHRERDDKRKSKSNKEENSKLPNEEDEIAEMNALRMKLGLKPLKP